MLDTAIPSLRCQPASVKGRVEIFHCRVRPAVKNTTRPRQTQVDNEVLPTLQLQQHLRIRPVKHIRAA
ncbi:hypothetical protein AGMMS49992_19800 [Clostridia bacterium]|nr:hypothetical protein AGMMS49992_19800 [Clostridia bacterium]